MPAVNTMPYKFQHIGEPNVARDDYIDIYLYILCLAFLGSEDVGWLSQRCH